MPRRQWRAPLGKSSDNERSGCPTRRAILREELVRPAGFEPAASGLEVPRSIQLSYGRMTVRHASNCSCFFVSPRFRSVYPGFGRKLYPPPSLHQIPSWIDVSHVARTSTGTRTAPTNRRLARGTNDPGGRSDRCPAPRQRPPPACRRPHDVRSGSQNLRVQIARTSRAYALRRGRRAGKAKAIKPGAYPLPIRGDARARADAGQSPVPLPSRCRPDCKRRVNRKPAPRSRSPAPSAPVCRSIRNLQIARIARWQVSARLE